MGHMHNISSIMTDDLNPGSDSDVGKTEARSKSFTTSVFLSTSGLCTIIGLDSTPFFIKC